MSLHRTTQGNSGGTCSNLLVSQGSAGSRRPIPVRTGKTDHWGIA